MKSALGHSSGKSNRGRPALTHYLYAIRLPVNDYGIAYIGVTKRLRARFRRHRNNEDDSNIGAALQQCSDVVFEVLESGGRSKIYAREVELIAELNTRWPNGYNLTPGGFGGRDPLPATRAKLSAAAKLPDRIARLVAMNKSPNMRARKSKFSKTPKHLAQLAAMISSSEVRGKISIAARSPKRIAQLVAMTKIPAVREKMSASARTPESFARRSVAGNSSKNIAQLLVMSERNRGKSRPPEVRAKISATKIHRRES